MTREEALAQNANSIALFNALTSGNTDVEALVDEAYANMLGLEGEFSNAGARKAFWVGQLQSGALSADDFASEFLFLAENEPGQLTEEERAYNTASVPSVAEASNGVAAQLEAEGRSIQDLTPEEIVEFAQSIRESASAAGQAAAEAARGDSGQDDTGQEEEGQEDGGSDDAPTPGTPPGTVTPTYTLEQALEAGISNLPDSYGIHSTVYSTSFETLEAAGAEANVAYEILKGAGNLPADGDGLGSYFEKLFDYSVSEDVSGKTEYSVLEGLAAYYANNLEVSDLTITTLEDTAANIFEGQDVLDNTDTNALLSKADKVVVITPLNVAQASALSNATEATLTYDIVDSGTAISEANVSILQGADSVALNEVVGTSAEAYGFSADDVPLQLADGENYVDMTSNVAQEVIGGAGNDTFNSVLGQTFVQGEVIDGGSGRDTLNLLGDSQSGAITSLPVATINNVEVANLISTVDGQAVLENVDASKFSGFEEIWQVGAATDVTLLGENQTAGFRSTDANTGSQAYTVIAADPAPSVSVALDEAGLKTENKPPEVSLSIGGQDIKTINVSGTIGVDGGKLSLIELPGGIDTVNLAMSSDTNLALYATSVAAFESVKEFNAAESTGGFIANFSSAPSVGLESVNFGSGDDVTSFDFSSMIATSTTVDLGAGNNEITLGGSAASATAVSVKLGDGNDRVILDDTIGNILEATESAFENSLTTVENFNLNEDEIDLGTLTVSFANETLQGKIDDLGEPASLFEALSLDGMNSNTIFGFKGDTYIYIDNSDIETNEVGFDGGDGLVQLVGVDVDLLSNSNGIVSGNAQA